MPESKTVNTVLAKVTCKVVFGEYKMTYILNVNQFLTVFVGCLSLCFHISALALEAVRQHL